MANELVARNGLRVSGSTFLGNVTTDQTLVSVLAIDSSNEVKDLSLATFAGDFVTGATLSGTGDKDLVLTQYDGSTITLTDINLHVDSASFDLASGDATLTQNDGNTVTLSLGTDFVTGVTEADNVVTVTKNGGADSTFTIDAITGLGYDGDWALSGTSTGVSAPAVELPFITGATLDLATGTLDLNINGGLENTISISGFSTTNSDTFVTGGTINSPVDGTLRLRLNDSSNVDVTGFSFGTNADGGFNSTIYMGDTLNFSGGVGIDTTDDGSGNIGISLTNSTFDVAGDTGSETIGLGGTLTIAGGVGLTTTAAATDTVTIDLDNTGVVAGTYGSSSEVPVFSVNAQGQITGVTDTTIDGSAINNNTITFDGTVGADPAVALNGTLSMISSDNSVVISGGTGTLDFTVSAGVDTFITGGTYTDNTGVLTLTDNDGTVVTVDGIWNHLESASIASNVLTFTSNTGDTTNLTVDAVTGITYGSWDVAFDGSGTLGTSPVELPFVTGGTYNAGTITLELNGGAGESDITITGIDGTDTYVTGATVDYQQATLELNQGATDVVIESEQTIRVERTGTGTLFNVPVGVYSAVHVEYSIIEGAGARSGFFTAIFNGGQVEYADWSTVDIGSVTGELSADVNGDVIFTGTGRIIANTRAVAL